MTLKTYCDFLASRARTSKRVEIDSLTAESISDILLEAIETMERASLVIDVAKYPLLVSRINNWLEKMNK